MGIFVLYKKEASRIEENLKHMGWNCTSIHGDKSQGARTQAVESFRDGDIPLLVATDVAARGLDIPDVDYVINFSFPLTIEDYVHRRDAQVEQVKQEHRTLSSSSVIKL